LRLQLVEWDIQILRRVEGGKKLSLVSKPGKGIARTGAFREQSPKLGISIQPIFPPVTQILTPIQSVFAPIADVFTPVSDPSDSLRIPDVFAPVTDVFPPVSTIFTPIPDIFPLISCQRWAVRCHRPRLPLAALADHGSADRQCQTGGHYKHHVCFHLR
jgi:hypothetical protein